MYDILYHTWVHICNIYTYISSMYSLLYAPVAVALATAIATAIAIDIDFAIAVCLHAQRITRQ